MKRKLLWALAVVVLLLVAVAIALPFLIDANRYRGMIEERAEQALGRDVRLGEIHLSFFPFGITADDVAIAALPEEGGGDLLTVAHLQVGARLLPLLSKRLEVTKVVLDGPSLELERGADGRWNVERLLAPEAAEVQGGETVNAEGQADPGTAVLVEALRLEGGRIAVRDTSFDPPLELVLTDLDAKLDDIAVDRPLSIDLAATVAGTGEGTGRIELEGNVGPLPDEPGAALPATLSVRLEDMPGSLVGWLTSTLGIAAGVREASLTLDLAGSIPQAFEARGAVNLAGAEVQLTGPDGAPRKTSFDADLSYDVAARDGGALIEIRSADLRVWDSALRIAGTARRAGEVTDVDLAIGPSTVAAKDLAAMAALVLGELPASFSSPTPIEVALTARGPVGGEAGPALAGQLKLADLTVQHPSIARPIEDLGATVEFAGEHVEVQGLSATVGSSQIAGDLTVDGFAAPAIGFDLSSPRADFGELLALLSPEDESTAAPAPAPAGTGPANSGGGAAEPPLEFTARGNLSIAEGTLDTLDFRDLRAGVDWRDGVLVLDPVSAQLYSGAFRGSVLTNLAVEPPTFELRGNAEAIDLGALLADNLDQPSLISGRFTGEVATAGAGLEFESIVRSLDGSGSIEVAEGRVGKLDVLETLAKVSGVFGEQTVQKLSTELASEGTDFERLFGKMRVENGTLKFGKLELDAPDFRLAGTGHVDLLSAQLDGEFLLTMSQQISESMLAEKSRAGVLFWNGESKRVEVPLELSGPFSEPSASIDFREVAQSALKGRIEAEARDLLADRLGDVLGKKDLPAPVAPDGTAAAPGTAGTAGAETQDATGAAAITRTEWSGSILARDLRIEGAVRLDGVKKAKVSVVDAAGKEFLADRIAEVDERLASGNSSGKVDWRAKIDGEKLLLAEMPLTVQVIVQHQDGTTSRTEVSVNR